MNPPADDSAAETAQGILLISPPSETAERVRGWFTLPQQIDILALPDRVNWQLICDDLSGDTLLVDNLSFRLDDADWNRGKLILLEKLILAQKKRLIVISRIDPIAYFNTRLQSPGDKADESYVTPEEIDRWARVLERLSRVDKAEDKHLAQLWATISKATLSSAPKLSADPLSEECRWTSRLRGIRQELELLQVKPDSEDQAAEVVRHAARAHYRNLWSALTDRQRLILLHIARARWENLDEPSWQLARGLLQSGLLRFAPELRLMNESFRQFVAYEAETEEEVRKWEAADGPSYWERVRNIAVPAMVIAGLMLSQVQPDILAYLVGVVTATGAAASGVANLFGLLQRAPGSPVNSVAKSAG